MHKLALVAGAINEWLGRLIAWLTLGMVIVTFLVVVLRYGFDLGWIAMQESVTYMHALVFMVGAAYTLKHDEHVRVDIFYRNFRPRTQAWINLLGTLVLLIPTAVFILWSSSDYVSSAWALRESSREAGGLPVVYLLKSLIPVFAVLLLLQSVALALHSLLRIVRKDE